MAILTGNVRARDDEADFHAAYGKPGGRGADA